MILRAFKKNLSLVKHPLLYNEITVNYMLTANNNHYFQCISKLTASKNYTSKP